MCLNSQCRTIFVDETSIHSTKSISHCFVLFPSYLYILSYHLKYPQIRRYVRRNYALKIFRAGYSFNWLQYRPIIYHDKPHVAIPELSAIANVLYLASTGMSCTAYPPPPRCSVPCCLLMPLIRFLSHLLQKSKPVLLFLRLIMSVPSPWIPSLHCSLLSHTCAIVFLMIYFSR